MGSEQAVSRLKYTVDYRIGALPYCVVPLTHSGKEIYEETPRARFKAEDEARVFADQLNGKQQMAAIINEQVIELPDDVVALIAATFSRDADTIEADGPVWDRVRAVFPYDLAPEPAADGITRIEVSA